VSCVLVVVAKMTAGPFAAGAARTADSNRATSKNKRFIARNIVAEGGVTPPTFNSTVPAPEARFREALRGYSGEVVVGRDLLALACDRGTHAD
jgi:hypothetical protein